MSTKREQNTAAAASSAAAATPEELAEVHAAFCAYTASRLNQSGGFGRNLPTAESLDTVLEDLLALFEVEHQSSRAETKVLHGGAIKGAGAPRHFAPEVPPELTPLFEPPVAPAAAPAPAAAAAAAAEPETDCVPLGVSLDHIFLAYNAVSLTRLAEKWAATGSKPGDPSTVWPQMLAIFSRRELFSLLLWGTAATKRFIRPHRWKQGRVSLLCYLLVRDGTELFSYGTATIRVLADELTERFPGLGLWKEFCIAYRSAAA